MPILDQLASELGLSPDELRQEILGGGEQLEPNYLTVDAAGKVGANFTGVVHAQGLTLDVPVPPGNPTNATKIRWLRTSDGAMIADMFSTDPDNNTGRLILDAYASVGGNAQAQLSLQAGSGIGGSRLSSFLENAGGTIRNLLIMDEASESDFLQLVATGTRKLIDFGVTTVAPGVAVTVAHGLGVLPVAVTATTFFNGAGAPNIGWVIQNLTTTHFDIFNPGAAQASVFWHAIG